MNSKDRTNIVPIPALKDNYIWALVDSAQHVIIVDPGEAAPVRAFLEKNKLILSGILITHHHWDHTNGIHELKTKYNVPVYGPKNESIIDITQPVGEHDTVSFPFFPLSFTVLGIPGHTLGHIAFYAPGILFCGDTLFAAGCGRLFEGTAAQLYSSLQKIAALPDKTEIYCAHEYTLQNLHFAQLVEPNNTHIIGRIKHVQALRDKHLPSLPSFLSEEKLTNPFLRCHSEELIHQVEKHAGKHFTSPVDVFAALRKWKDTF